MVDSDNGQAFSETIDIDEFPEDDTLLVECPEAWTVEQPYGNYTLWVEISAEGDVDEQNDVLGLDQIVMHYQDSRNEWLGYTDGVEGGNWFFGGDDNGFNTEAGWGVLFYHPGGPYPLDLTDLRVMTYKGVDEDIDLEMSVFVFNVEENSLDFSWVGTINPAFNNPAWVNIALDEEEYVRYYDGEAALVVWQQPQDAYLRRGSEAPFSATNEEMPISMLQTRDGANWSITRDFDAAIQVKLLGPEAWSGLVTGTVTALDGGDAIRDAVVRTSDGFETLTDADGKYELRNWVEGTFSLTVSKNGYRDSTITDLNIDPADTLVADFSLSQPQLELSEVELIAECLPDSIVTSEVTLTNIGNGVLDWEVHREWTSEIEYEPWEDRGEFEAAQIVADDKLTAVAFVDGLFYVGGSTPDTNKIYIFNENEDLIGEFNQPGNARNGIPDLAYDGEYLWGSGEGDVYQFDLEGNVNAIIEGPINPVKGIAYDSFNNWLWVCGSRTDIYALEMNGETAMQIEPPDIILGSLFYCPDDPDGFYLYAIGEDIGNDIYNLYKFNTNSGESTIAFQLESNEFEGAFATNHWDIYDWVLLSLEDVSAQDGGDILHITELYPNVSWVLPDINLGALEPDSSLTLTLTFNAIGLPRDQYLAKLWFHFNGINSPTVLPVEFNVFGGPRPPSAFELLEPSHDDTIGVETVEFIWRQSIDPNPEDEVSYLLWIKVGEDSVMYEAPIRLQEVDLTESGLAYEPGSEFKWWVFATSAGDTIECNNRFSFYYFPDSVNPLDQVPTEFAITGVYPNPFNATFEISYSLQRATVPKAEIYDFNGRLMSTIQSKEQSVGYHTMSVDASAWPSGIYMVRLKAGIEVRSAKIIAIK